MALICRAALNGAVWTGCIGRSITAAELYVSVITQRRKSKLYYQARERLLSRTALTRPVSERLFRCQPKARRQSWLLGRSRRAKAFTFWLKRWPAFAPILRMHTQYLSAN